MPFVASKIKDTTEYEEAKGAAQATIQSFAQRLDHRKVTVHVNTADRATRGDYYLTLTGTSAEMGDDGSVGRGNRVNGLITPFRTASLEAAAGKNPVSHVGKIYNVMSLLIAQDIIAKVPAAREVSVYILSQIGQPLDQPLMATATVYPKSGSLTPSLQADVEAIIDEHLQNDPARIREKLKAGELKMY
jgi:S-adenosylmethionine synthetase